MVLLVANRGEIALRIVRTAADWGVRTVAVYASDDVESAHVHAADVAVALPGAGPAAYLDGEAIIAAARSAGATLLHPGYGFLSESASFARLCGAAGITFVGPQPGVLEVFGDKSAARRAAEAAGLPVLPATAGPATLEHVVEFYAEHPGGIMIKALAGGGGRGMRAVHVRADVEAAFRACAAEATLGFGSDALYAEVLLDSARHVEVQIVADGATAVAVGDRDCSLQRRHQKVVEIAPAQHLSGALRRNLHTAAARLCQVAGLAGLATVEFLVAGDNWYFLEVNPRLQVEHTITEEVAGLDLVATALALANGVRVGELSLPDAIRADAGGVSGSIVTAHGVAVQARVNMETMATDGTPVPSAGTLTAFAPPTGPGVRVDTHGRPGYTPSPRYDSLLAKVVVHVRTPDLAAALRKCRVALDEFVVEGIATNLDFVAALVAHPDLGAGPVSTAFLAEHLPELVRPTQASARAVAVELGAGEEVVRAPMAGTLVEVLAEGVTVGAGGQVAVLEAMKMQHVLTTPVGARVVRVPGQVGQVVAPGDPVAIYLPTTVETGSAAADLDLDKVRGDLAELHDRQHRTRDDARPAAVAKRRKLGRRTARENIADLVDPGSFVEYGALTVAAQRSRRSEEDLIANTPADGLIVGVATIGGAECVVLSYDYTVLAGTQGRNNHVKTDRAFDIATRRRIPVVLFAEGGGGRPGDTDAGMSAGLELSTFRALAALNGRVPLVSIVSGRCFAGNAALAGVCDVIIATPDANIGMGGPAMIEGGGLGVVAPEEIGPIDVQRRNGVVDLVARDEAHAVELAKQYLGYFRGAATDWEAPDPRLARHVVPENRLRAYDIRRAIEAIADVGSVLELCPDYGVGAVTALVRVAGEPYGLVANSGHHLGGAIDAAAADKFAEFLTRCDAFGLPIVSLCDTPGLMVGPAAEKEASVRRFGRMFIAGARVRVPFGTVILRKGYGLGAMAMAAGGFHAADFTVAWPTGEIGGMGLEGAVRLGFAKELAAADDPDTAFGQLVALAYQHGKALSAATTFQLDDVIDPADTRRWIGTLAHRRFT